LWADIVLHNNLSVRFLWPRLLVFKPVVISLQTWLPGTKAWVKKLSLNLASRVIACSEAIRRELFKRALVIGNPYDNELFRIIPGVHRRRSIVFLGRLVDDKGVALLLEAFAKLNSPDWRLSIIGGGPELPSLIDLADKLGISNSVSFLGPLQGDELVYALNQHEVMVVPSRWREPFGIVALEGLACGCSLLVSDGGGLPDAVGQSGLVFERCNHHSLAKNLSALIHDEELRKSLRSRSTGQLSQHTKSKVCQQYLDVLTTASGRRNESP
jgi:glycosyltransferase involved in cell wall biosynthesis